jgi:hypothetical protein
MTGQLRMGSVVGQREDDASRRRKVQYLQPLLPVAAAVLFCDL